LWDKKNPDLFIWNVVLDITLVLEEGMHRFSLGWKNNKLSRWGIPDKQIPLPAAAFLGNT
jgi:hypothetical protein